MTSGLDIVTRDAGEQVRTARARDSGEEALVSLYRLAQMVRMHDVENQAFQRALEATHKAVVYYCLHAGNDLVILFAERVVLIGGQLLQGSHAAYEAAAELGDHLLWCGGAELTIQRDVQPKDLKAFAEALGMALRTKKGADFKSPTVKIKLRSVPESVRVRGLTLERLKFEQRLVRTYASAVVVMRRFFEGLRAGRMILPRRLKRVAQNLVDLSEGKAPAFLGVTEVRNANHDEAGRAVNTAILAVAAARELTSDRILLSQLAMAALMHDVGRPRAESKLPKGGAIAARLSEHDEDALPAGTAVVLNAIGRLNEPTIARTVITYEALWLKRRENLGAPYESELEPTLQARIIAVARRYNDLLTPEPGLAPPLPDYAVATLATELSDQEDQIVLRMLAGALGLMPVGTVVQLAGGETGEVVASPDARPASKPRIKLVLDARGNMLHPPRLVDLAKDDRFEIAKVVSTDGWAQGLEPVEAGEADDAPEPEPESQSSVSAADQSFLSVPSAASANFSLGWSKQAPSAAAPISSRPEPPRIASPPISSRPAPARNAPTTPAPGRKPESHPAPSRPIPSGVPVAPVIIEHDAGDEHTVYEPSPYGAQEHELQEEQEPEEGTAFYRREDNPALSQPASAPTTATATGNLKTTPLPHVLVYMLDRGYTGSLALRDPDTKTHVIYFEGGAPSKVYMANPIAPLGEELIAARQIAPPAYDACVVASRQTGMRISDFLVQQGLVSPDAMGRALRSQRLHQIEWLAKLPDETTYEFYQDYDALARWSGEGDASCEPFDIILAANRVWRSQARIINTLTRLADHRIILHPDADLDGLTLAPEEQTLLDVIRQQPLTMPELYNLGTVGDKVVSTFLYTLLVTRQLALPGQQKPPMRRHGSEVRMGPTSLSPGSMMMSRAPTARDAAPASPRPSREPAPPSPRYSRELEPAPQTPRGSAEPVAPSSPRPPPPASDASPPRSMRMPAPWKEEPGRPSKPAPSHSIPDSAPPEARRMPRPWIESKRPPAPAAPASVPAAVHLPQPAEPEPVPTRAEAAIEIGPPSYLPPQQGPVDPAEFDLARGAPAAAEQDIPVDMSEGEDDDSMQSFPSFGTSPSAVTNAIESVLGAGNDPLDPSGPARGPLLISKSAPSASGDLTSTPTVHILIYMLDHAQSGTVVIHEPDGTEHAIEVRDGHVTKVKTGRPVALLGALLVEAGLLPADAVERCVGEAALIDAPLGEFLVLQEGLDRVSLEQILHRQLLLKAAAVSNQPPGTTYVFYRDEYLLEGWGGKAVVKVEPLAIVLAAVRAWTDRNRIRGTLYKMKDRVLQLSPQADVSCLISDETALAILAAIEPGTNNVLGLYRTRVADEEEVNSLVYTLAVMRFFSFSAAKGPPMGLGPRRA